MKIYPVNNDPKDKNRYCGPAAISIVTGMSTGEAARLIRGLTGKASVKGVGDYDLIRALKVCGVQVRRLPTPSQPAVTIGNRIEVRPTMTMWLKDSQKIRTPGRVFLVSAGHHWQIVSGRRFCCGRTCEIVSITDKKANRRARVSEVYELTADKITIPDMARKPKSTVCPYRTRLADVEKSHGFNGKLAWNIGVRDYEVPPCPTFPHGFSTMHHDWAETLDRVIYCIDPEVYASLGDENYHYSA